MAIVSFIISLSLNVFVYSPPSLSHSASFALSFPVSYSLSLLLSLSYSTYLFISLRSLLLCLFISYFLVRFSN